MEELKGIVSDKLVKYSGLRIISKELGNEADVIYYGDCVSKLNEIFKILFS